MSIKSRRLLITGATGFLGSHFTKALRTDGCDYRTFGRSCPRGTSEEHHFMGDVTDFESLETAITSCDLVVHLACVPLPESIKNPSVCFDVNAGGTNNVARAVSELDRELLVVSTSEVYGPKTKLPIQEDDILEPTSTYGASKQAGEGACGSWNRIAGLKYSTLRFFNIMGPSSEGLIRNTVDATFLKCALEGQVMTIKGNRRNSRDFLYIDDASHREFFFNRGGNHKYWIRSGDYTYRVGADSLSRCSGQSRRPDRDRCKYVPYTEVSSGCDQSRAPPELCPKIDA